MLKHRQALTFLNEELEKLRKRTGDANLDGIKWEDMGITASRTGDCLLTNKMPTAQAKEIAALFEKAGLPFVIARVCSEDETKYRLSASFTAVRDYHHIATYTFPVFFDEIKIDLHGELFKPGITFDEFRMVLLNTLEKNPSIIGVDFIVPSIPQIDRVTFPQYVEATKNAILDYTLASFENMKLTCTYKSGSKFFDKRSKVPACLEQANQELSVIRRQNQHNFERAAISSLHSITKVGIESPTTAKKITLPRELVGMMFNRFISADTWTPVSKAHIAKECTSEADRPDRP